MYLPTGYRKYTTTTTTCVKSDTVFGLGAIYRENKQCFHFEAKIKKAINYYLLLIIKPLLKYHL